MPAYTRLEVPFVQVPGIDLMRVRYPATVGAWIDMSLPLGTYPHKQAWIEAWNTAFSGDGRPLTMSEDYTTGTITLGSSGSNFDLSFDLAETAGNAIMRSWAGFPLQTYSDVASISFSPPTTLILDSPPTAEEYEIRVVRKAAFGDDGRVGAVLTGRHLAYACTVRMDNDEHAGWLTFATWLSRCRQLCLWRRFDPLSGASVQYVANPYLGDTGFKYLFLDESEDLLDNPEQTPAITGHTVGLSGVIYGV